MIDPIVPEEFSYGIDMAGVDPASLNDALNAVMTDAMRDPMRIGTWMTSLMLAEQNVGMNMLRRLGGMEPLAGGAATGDKRFSDPEWSENPLLAGMVEEYRIRSDAALQLVETSRLPEATKRKARFAVQLMNDSLAPSNVPWINPGVVNEAMDTRGKVSSRACRTFSTTSRTTTAIRAKSIRRRFVLGENIGATPGRVVMRNELIELIALRSANAESARDSAADVSAVDQQVLHHGSRAGPFVRRVGREARPSDVHDQLPQSRRVDVALHDGRLSAQGLLAALDAVQDITGAPKVDLAALCLGGTLALIALAYLAAHGQGDRINSATLTNTLVDFSIPGDLGVFTDEATISQAREEDGTRRATSSRRRWPKHVRLDARERSDLELRRQQLVQGQAAARVRHPLVERRLDAHAGRDALAVSALVLPAQLDRDAERVLDRRHADRPRQDPNADLRARRRRRSHRAVACDVSDDAARRAAT